MDLIYMNAQKEDIGVLKDYTMDLAYGSDENDFECKVSITNNVCEPGYYLYFEGEEYGGMVDKFEVDTEGKTITYTGRTWHGIMNSKILMPDANQDYLVCNGEANAVVKSLIIRMNLTSLFSVSTANSGINISNYKMDRYIRGYFGLIKMLKSKNAKLNVTFKNGMVNLEVVPAIDYSQDEQFDTDQIAFKIQQNFKPINHVICLGKGDLKDRRVIHVYADKLGNISGTQSLTGVDEICYAYENSNTESDDELTQGGIDIIQQSYASNSVDFSFNTEKEYFDIFDIIGAKELTTGTTVRAYITKKIVKIERDLTTIEYECEAGPGTVASNGYQASGTGATIIIDSALSTTSANPVQNKVVTSAINGKLDKSGGTITGNLTVNGKFTGSAKSDLLRATLAPEISIPSNADLNTIQYLKVGRYYCGTDVQADTLKNSPTVRAFMMEVYSVLSPTYDEEVSSPDWVYRVRKITTRMGNEYIQEVSSNESGTFSFKPWKKIVYEELTSGRATFNDTNGGTYAARSVIWKRFNHVVVVDFYDISMTPKVTNSQSSVLATGLPKAKHNGTTMISSINGQAKRVGIVGGSTSIVWWWTGTVTANSPALSGQLVYICE